MYVLERERERERESVICSHLPNNIKLNNNYHNFELSPTEKNDLYFGERFDFAFARSAEKMLFLLSREERNKF